MLVIVILIDPYDPGDRIPYPVDLGAVLDRIITGQQKLFNWISV